VASEKVWTADSRGMLADIKSTAGAMRLNVTVVRLGDTAAGGWVYVEISGPRKDVKALVDAIT
jgi:hypothetical protein